MNRPTSRTRVRLFVAAVIAITAYCVVEGTRYGIASWYASRGLDVLQDGDLDRGIELIDLAGNWHDEHPGRLVLARQLFESGSLDGAEAILVELTAAPRTQIDALELLGRIEEERGDLRAARRRFQALVDAAPDHPSGYLGLARSGLRGPLETLLASRSTPIAVPPYRGVSLLHLADALGSSGYGTADAALSLWLARDLGANAVSLRVPIRQRAASDPELTAWAEPIGSETRRAIVRQIRDARALGLAVMLKPHVMLETIADDAWRGVIAFDDPSEAQTWWDGYRTFMVELLTIARLESVEIICLGVELRGLVAANPEEWRGLIRLARTMYDGKLTYAANWYLEFEEVPFWSELDYVGVQFFFPIAESAEPTRDELQRGAASAARRVREVAARAGKPVIWTEIGMRSTPGAAVEPWIWPEPGDPPSAELQQRAYTVFTQMVEREDWLHGMFLWNWLTTPKPGLKFEHDFTPQGKPAEDVLGKVWR